MNKTQNIKIVIQFKMRILFGFILFSAVFISCKKKEGFPENPAEKMSYVFPPPPPPRPASLGYAGDSTDVKRTTSLGIMLMGGGTDVDQAIQWMIGKSGGGNGVVIRATGAAAYNSYIKGLGNLRSVETLLINSRELANNDTVANTIRNAEFLFIAGGDQSDYVKYWKDTKVMDALNYLLTVKKIPFGGTSAGAAIIGDIYFSAENGGLTSAECLPNPYNNYVVLRRNDFIKTPFLSNVVTDQHFLTRARQGRSMVFLARAIKDWNVTAPKAICVDEKTAVCIDSVGVAKVFGSSKAYFLLSDPTKPPEVCVAGVPLNYNAAGKAVRAYEITGSATGAGNFSVNDFDIAKASGGTWYWWSVNNGTFNSVVQ